MLELFLKENEISAVFNDSMKKHTTFKVGGPAKCIAMPDTIDKSVTLIKYLNSAGIKYYFLGNGSNVIFSDEGYDGVIIKTSQLNKYEMDTDNLTACVEAGVLLTAFSRKLAENGLSGMEFAYGIPGNIGGGVFMNAGAYGGQMSDCVESVTFVDENGEIKTISAADCRFNYRHSVFMDNKWLVLQVNLKLKSGNRAEMLAYMDEIMDKRKSKQPLDKPSAGSSFKRPEGYFAAALIDECGLKGFSVGGAQVSEKHAGFIVNTGDATCADITALADKVSEIVLEQKGVKLEKEMIIVK